MTVVSLIQSTAEQLLPRYNDVHLATQYAWWMLEEVTGQSRTQLIVKKDIILTQEQNAQLANWVARQVNNHEPLAYILGSTPFAHLQLAIKPPILIPRPETEEWTLSLIEQLKPFAQMPLHILDMCCGSGCIGLAIAKALPKAHVWSVDISEKALELAQHNAAANAITNITFIQSDLFSNIPKTQQFDLIVSNPPYIAQSELDGLEESVRKWEDVNALIAPNNGLQLIHDIITTAPQYSRSVYQLPIQLLIEMGYRQGNELFQFMNSHGYTDVQVNKDLQGNDRYITGRIARVAQNNSCASGSNNN